MLIGLQSIPAYLMEEKKGGRGSTMVTMAITVTIVTMVKPIYSQYLTGFSKRFWGLRQLQVTKKWSKWDVLSEDYYFYGDQFCLNLRQY